MAPEAAELIQAGLALDPDERAVVVNRLLASLHDDSDGEEQVEVDEAWRNEIARRLDEVLDGSVTPVDADEHYAQLRARTAAGTE